MTNHTFVQRMAEIVSLAALLLSSMSVHAQHAPGCEPIPPGQTAKLCGFSVPVYPPGAKAAGIEDTVKVFAQINRSGDVDLAWVISGPEQLREAALEAVKSWTYRPFLIDGKATGFRSVVNVKFTLERSSHLLARK